MNITRRSRATLAGTCTLAALALAVPPPAAAAPYTDDALLTISTTNPVIGGTLTITLLNFQSGELVDIDLHSVVRRLTTVQVDSAGGFTTTVTLPSNFVCEHHLTATGRSFGEIARTDLLIGEPRACTAGGNGNTGNGNSGNGNTGNGNSGNGNTGNGNSGNGNTGNGNGTGNGGYGDTGIDQDDWGNVSYVRGATSAPQSHAAELAAVSIAGLTVLGGAGFLHRRRRPS